MEELKRISNEIRNKVWDKIADEKLIDDKIREWLDYRNHVVLKRGNKLNYKELPSYVRKKKRYANEKEMYSVRREEHKRKLKALAYEYIRELDKVVPETIFLSNLPPLSYPDPYGTRVEISVGQEAKILTVVFMENDKRYEETIILDKGE